MDDILQNGSARRGFRSGWGAERNHQLVFNAAMMLPQHGGWVVERRWLGWFVSGANNVDEGRITRWVGRDLCSGGLLGVLISWGLKRWCSRRGGGVGALVWVGWFESRSDFSL